MKIVSYKDREHQLFVFGLSSINMECGRCKTATVRKHDIALASNDVCWILSDQCVCTT